MDRFVDQALPQLQTLSLSTSPASSDTYTGSLKAPLRDGSFKMITPQHLLLASGVQACDVSRVVAVLICVCLASIKRLPQPEGFDFVGYRPNHYVAKSPQHCFSMNASEPAPRKYKPTQVYA